jgi:predicted RNase H-like HicB family nuclease
LRASLSKLRYVVRIDRDPDSDWGASVLDLPGCVATGKTVDTTLRRIRPAIRMHVDGLREDGHEPPKPRRRVTLPGRGSWAPVVYALVEVAT